jgi:3-methylcrotonyl-CoA carboxylase beta subunit
MSENRHSGKTKRKNWTNESMQATWPGGQKAVDRLAKQGKQPGAPTDRKAHRSANRFLNWASIAGFGVNYPGGIEDVPCGGVVTGIGKINGNWTMIFANDSRVKAGTYFPITLKKHMRAQAIAERCGLNCVYIADSGGAFLPMQADVFPDDQHFGSMFYNMARMSAMGLKQITLSTGGNTAGGAYIVFMACQSIMIDRMSYSFLGGPPLVKMATGEVISAEDLGGARVHTGVSGGADHFCADQDEAITGCGKSWRWKSPAEAAASPLPGSPALVPPRSRSMTYAGRQFTRASTAACSLQAIADDSYFMNTSQLCPGTGRQHHRRQDPHQGDSGGCDRLQFRGHHLCRGGPQSRRVDRALQPGERPAAVCPELSGLHGGLRFRAHGHRQIRSGHGAGRILRPGTPDPAGHRPGQRCGQLRHVRQGLPAPFPVFHTMRSRTSVMSGRSAAGVLLSIEERKRAAKNNPMTEEEKQAFSQKMIDKYDGEAHPFYCGARLLSDRVLKFAEIRDWLAMAFEVSLLQPMGEPSFGNFRF